MKKTIMLSFILMSTSLFGAEALAAAQCDRLFSAPLVIADVKKSIRELAQLKLKLDLEKAKGAQSIELTALSFDYVTKENELIGYLESHTNSTRPEVIKKIKTEIQKIQKEEQALREEEIRHREQKAIEFRNGVIDGTYAILHRIKPGSFKMGYPTKQVKVTLTKAFDMMATPMTQIIWRQIVVLAKVKHGLPLNLEEDPSEVKGHTFPVTHVSYKDVRQWIMALNKLSKLGEPALTDLIPDHKQGDVYRLPTEAEWEFVARGRGKHKGDYFFGDDPSQIANYAWFRGNADFKLRAVAQKLPLIIDGKKFYDILGNVAELTSDIHEGDQSRRVIRGGSIYYAGHDLRSYDRTFDDADYRSVGTGFRLVRSVR